MPCPKPQARPDILNLNYIVVYNDANQTKAIPGMLTANSEMKHPLAAADLYYY